MKNKFLKIFVICLIIFLIVFTILFLYPEIKENNSLKKENELKEKILTEVSYNEKNIIDALNKLNNINITRYKIITEQINTNNEQNQSNISDENSKSNNENKSDSQSGSGENQNNSSNNSQNTSGENQNDSSNSESNIMKKYNVEYNNSLTENNSKDIDWDDIEYIYENIFTAWQTMQVDLKTENVNEDSINKITSNLNGIASSILNQNKENALINYFNLYSNICDVVKYVSNDQNLMNLYYAKLYLLNSYILCESEKWDEMYNSVSNAENYYKNSYTENDNKNNKQNEKIIMSISNLKDSINLKDKNIFYMQYKNVIQLLML